MRKPARVVAPHAQLEPLAAVLSFPRKRESELLVRPTWMPAFAGMTQNDGG